jgi:hypothetical protein
MSAGNVSSKKEDNSYSYGNDCSQDLRNYRSAFFEDDSELEKYHMKVRDALQVQLQKEIDISSDLVQQQYRHWSALL